MTVRTANRLLAAVLFATACSGGGVRAPAGTGTGGAGGQDARSVDAPGPFTGWTTCEVLTNDRPPRPPYALSASMDGRWLALLDGPVDGWRDPQSVALWNLPATTVARRITDVDSGSLAADVDVSPDGAWVAITGDGSQLVRTSDGAKLWELPPPPEAPLTGGWTRIFAFSPDGLTLASARSFHLNLFRASDGVLTRTMVSKASSSGVAFSPDGLFLASSAPSLWRLADQTAVWDFSIDEPSTSTFGLTDHWATFSPDGTLILLQFARLPPGDTTLTFQTQTQLTDPATGALLRDLGRDLPRRPTFSPDGRWVLAGDRLINLQNGATSSLGAPATLSHFLADGRVFAADDAGARVLCPH